MSFIWQVCCTCLFLSQALLRSLALSLTVYTVNTWNLNTSLYLLVQFKCLNPRHRNQSSCWLVSVLSLAVYTSMSHLLEICRNEKNESDFSYARIISVAFSHLWRSESHRQAPSLPFFSLHFCEPLLPHVRYFFQQLPVACAKGLRWSVTHAIPEMQCSLSQIPRFHKFSDIQVLSETVTELMPRRGSEVKKTK